jgi:hypothetical protein
VSSEIEVLVVAVPAVAVDFGEVAGIGDSAFGSLLARTEGVVLVEVAGLLDSAVALATGAALGSAKTAGVTGAVSVGAIGMEMGAERTAGPLAVVPAVAVGWVREVEMVAGTAVFP